jgi:MFS family permease
MPANQKRILGFPRNVFALGWTSFLNDTASEMIYPLLPVFLTMTLGVGAAFLGLIEGIAESTASLVKLFSGWLSDRLGKRKGLVLFGYGLAAVARPLIAVSHAAWQVLLIRAGDRAGKGVRGSPRDALVAASCEENERGKAFGFQRSMDHAGAIVGPLLASLVLFLIPGNYRLMFALASIPGTLTLPLIALSVREVKPASSPARKAVKLSLSPFSRKFKVYLAVLVLFTLGNSSDAFLLLRAKTLGVGVALLPILWIVLHLVKMLTSVPGGVLSDRLGRKGVIVAGWLIYALVYLGFGMAGKSWQVWALFAVYGLFFGLTEGVEKAFVADLVPEALRGTAYGLYNFAIGIAALPASLILGLIWQTTRSALLAFGLGGALAFLASLLLWLFVREK